MFRRSSLQSIVRPFTRRVDSRRSSGSNGAVATCESLEARMLLAGTALPAGIHLDGGTLSVVGTEANDAIKIAEKNGTVLVKAVGETASYDAGSLSQIVIFGEDGNDKIAVTSPSTPVQVHAGAGADKITVIGDAEIYGEDGNDVVKAIHKSDGSAHIDGGKGDDKIAFASVYESAVSIVGGEGNDVIKSKTFSGSSIDAGSGDDRVIGGIGDDTITGGDGNDAIAGLAGRDLLFGNSGNDVLASKSGNAMLVGGGGDDILSAGKFSGLLIGGTGSDQLRGSKAADVLIDGSTSYDSNHSLLNQTLDAWMSDDVYNRQVEAVLSLLNAATITHDTSTDTLLGGKSHDLFFARVGQDSVDADACESAIDTDVAAGPSKHLFILSGQSNMERHIPDEAFTPAVQAALGSDRAIVVQDAWGGQPIRRWYRDWTSVSGKTPKSTGDLYDRLMCKVHAAIQGHTIESVTFIWMQGERDAKERQGGVYSQSLEGLHEQLGDDLGRTDVNFVIGRLSDHDMENRKYGDWTMIRDIQVNVAHSEGRFTWINTDDLNDGINRQGKLISDDLHYSAEGYRTLGQRFAAAALSLITG